MVLKKKKRNYSCNHIDMRIINRLQHNSGAKMPCFFKIIVKETLQS